MRAAAGLLTTILVLALAGAAHAATVSLVAVGFGDDPPGPSGPPTLYGVDFVAAPGEVNDPQVTSEGADLVVSDGAAGRACGPRSAGWTAPTSSRAASRGCRWSAPAPTFTG